MFAPMASSMICSSSLLVIITIGIGANFVFIRLMVSKPEMPGMFSSKKTISAMLFSISSMASFPLLAVITRYPLVSKKMICGFNNSISSSAQRMVIFCDIILFFYGFNIITWYKQHLVWIEFNLHHMLS